MMSLWASVCMTPSIHDTVLTERGVMIFMMLLSLLKAHGNMKLMPFFGGVICFFPHVLLNVLFDFIWNPANRHHIVLVLVL